MKQFCIWAATLAMVALPAATQANLLDDGSFLLADHNSSTSNSSWALNVNSPDGTNPAAQFRQDSWANFDGPMGVWFRAFEGNDDDGPANADVTQQLLAPQSGSYLLQFYAKRETHFDAEAWTGGVSSSGTGGLAAVNLLESVANDGQWSQQSALITGVTAGDTLIVSAAMTNGKTAMSNPQSAFVDGFSLELIPEPTSIALAGLGVMSLLGLHRRR